jgi:hypothetical protein
MPPVAFVGSSLHKADLWSQTVGEKVRIADLSICNKMSDH